MKRVGIAAIALLAGATVLTAPQRNITVKGSDTLVILGQRWAEVYMKNNPGVTIQVTGGGSGTGIAALINATTDIAEASRPMKERELAALKQKRGKQALELPVAVDGLAVYLNQENPVKELSLAQLKASYTGAVKNRTDLGGHDQRIILYGRENNSGTYVYFKEHVLEKADYHPRMQTLPGTAAVIHAVANDPRGIGYGGTNYSSGIGYNAAGQVTGFNYGNGVVASFTYSAQRLQLSSLKYTKGANTLFHTTYGYSQGGGNNGQITSITDNVDSGRTVSYTYDALHRLKSAVTNGSGNYPQWGLSWTYDRYGNRTQQTVTQGSAPSNSLSISATTNRITSSGFSYDSSGNLTNDALNTYTYDGENRMKTVNGTGAAYYYDGAGLRVKKVVGSTTTRYIFSGTKVIAEYVNGALSKEYIYSGSQLLATLTGGTPTYHHQDQLSVRVNTNSSGSTVGQQGHYPFGESWYASSTTTKWQFTTYERDSESTLDYAMLRHQCSRLGRFMTPDRIAGSIRDPQSLNRYAYVGNDPVNFTDPLGLLARCYTERFWVDYVVGSSEGYYVDFSLCWPDEDFGGRGWLGRRDEEEGISGGGGGGRTPGQQEIADVVNLALQQEKLAECLNKHFGPSTILTNQNLPFIDTRLPQQEIEALSQPGAIGAQEQPVPATGRGTVLMAREVFYNPTFTTEALAALYIHETGNILAYQRFTDSPYDVRPWLGPQGRPPSESQLQARDKDIGTQLETCVFGRKVF